MITERTLATVFPSSWRELFPFFTSNFMRVFNEANVIELTTKHGESVCPVPVNADTNRLDLVAELAIHSTRLACGRNISVESVFSDIGLLRIAWRSSQALIDRYEGRKPTVEFNLAEDEQLEACALARNLGELLSSLDGEIEFSPRIPGAGVIGECEADLSIGRTLFEIKTVNRNYPIKGSKTTAHLFDVELRSW